jgi:formylglycine-generating enzyme required for sulfatase activity
MITKEIGMRLYGYSSRIAMAPVYVVMAALLAACYTPDADSIMGGRGGGTGETEFTLLLPQIDPGASAALAAPAASSRSLLAYPPDAAILTTLDYTIDLISMNGTTTVRASGTTSVKASAPAGPLQIDTRATLGGYPYASGSVQVEITRSGENQFRVPLYKDEKGFLTVGGTISADNPAGPLAGATVQLMQGVLHAGPAVTTDPNGKWAVHSVGPGDAYYITVSKAGYHTGRSAVFNITDTTGLDGNDLTLTLIVYSMAVEEASGQSTWGSTSISVGSASGNYPNSGITVSAMAASGYRFDRWTSDPAGTITVSTANPHSFNIIANTTLYAVFHGQDMTRTINSVSIPFHYVPAGSFRRDSAPGNVSVITRGFWMGETEVTQELFQEVMDTNPSQFTSAPDGAEVQNKRPAEQVSWYAAITFCNKLSLADGKEPVYTVSGVDWSNFAYNQIPTASNTAWDAVTADFSKNGYRLPTEMEWFWAAMGADKTSQPNTGDYQKIFAGSTGSNNANDYTWHVDIANNKTHAGGTKLANELGFFDMSGNVWEWCWDRYTDPYPNGVLIDYASVSGSNRARRGCSHNYGLGSDGTGHAIKNRGSDPPYSGSNSIGFRVVCRAP